MTQACSSVVSYSAISRSSIFKLTSVFNSWKIQSWHKDRWKAQTELPRKSGWLHSIFRVTLGPSNVTRQLLQSTATVEQQQRERPPGMRQGRQWLTLPLEVRVSPNILLTQAKAFVAHGFDNRVTFCLSFYYYLLSRRWALAHTEGKPFSFVRAQRQAGTMCAMAGEEAHTRQSNWSFTCMPSWPEIPTPTSATWIMLTSFAPSPRNNTSSKNHWFWRCRDSGGHIEPLGSRLGWVLWGRSGKGQKRKLRWPIGIRHSTTWNCQPYQAVPETNCHGAPILFSVVFTIRIRTEKAFNVMVHSFSLLLWWLNPSSWALGPLQFTVAFIS